jgi:hypothetical protein
MKRLIAAVAIVALWAIPARAEPDRALGMTAGLAVAVPTTNGRGNAYGAGGMLMGEYVKWPGNWFSPRAYAGVLLAGPSATSCDVGLSPCDVSEDLVFVGGKFRLLLPIPYVGPFLELGIGASVGHSAAHVGQSIDVEKNGVFLDVPFAFGLALGAQHRFQLSLQYLFHPGHDVAGGALSIGYDFSI